MPVCARYPNGGKYFVWKYYFLQIDQVSSDYQIGPYGKGPEGP